MRLTHRVLRFVALQGRELRRRSQWRSPHASAPPDPASIALRGPIGSSTEGSSGAVCMRLPRP
eukprot:2956828-Pyramimonas_sp.AAC.1